MITRVRPALGTLVEVSIAPPDGVDWPLEHAFTVAFAAIDTVQGLMSVHEPLSDLSQLNGHAHQQPYRPHPWTLAVLRRALRVYRQSAGLFDCAVAAQCLTTWQLLPDHSAVAGFTRSSASALPDSFDVHQPATLADVQCLADGRVHFKRPLRLDFGGIAKGFAVDMAVLALYRAGVRRAVVNAGGDLRVLGSHAQEIRVRHPQNPQQLVLLGELAAGALATSGVYYSQQTTPDGQTVSALVQPHSTSQATMPTPILAAQSYSVIAPTAIMADALTKVLACSQDPQHPALLMYGAQGVVFA
ncbi:MAG: hypothetical protein RL180_1359 [Pseudomonadota bacterium]